MFLESDLWSLSQDASADQNFNDMAANNGEDSGLPDTIWRAGNGVVCCNFDIELSKNLAGAYDVRRKQWLTSELNLENEAKEAVDSYASHWHHHNPDAGLRPHQENPPARDRSASRPPGSRSGPSAQRDSRWQQRQTEHSERFRSQTPGRERNFRARERTPPARTTQQTRWTNRRPTEPDAEPENRARPQAKRRLSPHFGQARSRENTPAPTRRTPVSLTPRQDVPRSRPQSRTRFGDYSEEQDYNPDSPPNHVARSRSPSTASRGGVLRTPRASQQNTARTTQRTAASPRRILRAEARHLGELRGNQTILHRRMTTLLCTDSGSGILHLRCCGGGAQGPPRLIKSSGIPGSSRSQRETSVSVSCVRSRQLSTVLSVI